MRGNQFLDKDGTQIDVIWVNVHHEPPGVDLAVMPVARSSRERRGP